MATSLLERLPRLVANGRRQAQRLMESSTGRNRERAVPVELVLAPDDPVQQHRAPVRRVLCGAPALCVAALIAEQRQGIALAPGRILIDLHPAGDDDTLAARLARWAPCFALLRTFAPDAALVVDLPANENGPVQLVLDAFGWPESRRNAHWTRRHRAAARRRCDAAAASRARAHRVGRLRTRGRRLRRVASHAAVARRYHFPHRGRWRHARRMDAPPCRGATDQRDARRTRGIRCEGACDADRMHHARGAASRRRRRAARRNRARRRTRAGVGGRARSPHRRIHAQPCDHAPRARPLSARGRAGLALHAHVVAAPRDALRFTHRCPGHCLSAARRTRAIVARRSTGVRRHRRARASLGGSRTLAQRARCRMAGGPTR